MAAVIRDARMEPDRVLLSVVARSSHAPRNAPALERAAQPMQEPSAPAATPTATAPAPRLPTERRVEAHAAYGIEPPAHAAEEADFRERLEAERMEVLEKAENDGFAAGLDKAEAAYARQIDGLSAVIASARDALEAGVAGVEDVILEIAFEAVCKILGDAMRQRDGVMAAVREVLSTMRERERLVVRVSPADYELLEQHRGQLITGDDAKMIDLAADERVMLGGCLVETSGGTLDGRLETQLQRLIDILSTGRRLQESL